MALDASSNENFNTRNPEEAVKVTENLASSNSSKLDSVHKLLRKQVCLVEDAEAVDTKKK